MALSLSVIIPLYNVEKYIEKCVESVFRQSFKDFELILVDDGSTDKSGEICDGLVKKYPNVRVIHKENGGASSARNIGLKAAKGEYVYCLDSDDYLADNAFELLIKKAREENSDIVYFDAYTFHDGSDELSTKNYSHKEKYPTSTGKQALSSMINNGDFHVSIPLLLIKRSFLEKTGLTLIEGIMYEDCIYTYELFYKAGNVSYLPEYLYYRRLRDNSVMTAKKTEKNIYSALMAFNELVKFADETVFDTCAEKYILRIAYNVINCYEEQNNEIKKKYEKQYSEFVSELKKRNCLNDTAMKMRLKGKAFWVAYKAAKKFGF